MKGLLNSILDLVSENCPIRHDFVSGGQMCPRNIHATCINDNIGYPDLASAWKRCGQVPECKRIMKYYDGKYYLRRATDPACCQTLQHVDYKCPGNDSYLQLRTI